MEHEYTGHKHGRKVIIESPDMKYIAYHKDPWDAGYEFDHGEVLAHIYYADGERFRTIHAPDAWIDWEALAERWIKVNSRY